MTVHQRDGPGLSGFVHGGDGIDYGSRVVAAEQFARGHLGRGDAFPQQVGIHRHGVEMGALDNPLGMDEQGASGVYKRRDTGHGHLFRVAQAGIQE